MAVQVTARNVPEAARDEFAARAALVHESMQEYLRDDLERPASRPPVARWLERVRELQSVTRARRPDSEISFTSMQAVADARCRRLSSMPRCSLQR